MSERRTSFAGLVRKILRDQPRSEAAPPEPVRSSAQEAELGEQLIGRWIHWVQESGVPYSGTLSGFREPTGQLKRLPAERVPVTRQYWSIRGEIDTPENYDRSYYPPDFFEWRVMVYADGTVERTNLDRVRADEIRAAIHAMAAQSGAPWPYSD